MRLIYLAHPYGGRPENLERAKRWLAWALRFTAGFDTSPLAPLAPIAPWIAMCEAIGADDLGLRRRGLDIDCAVVAECFSTWLVGGAVTPGMEREAAAASDAGANVLDLTWMGPEPPVKGDCGHWKIPHLEPCAACHMLKSNTLKVGYRYVGIYGHYFWCPR